MTPARPIQLSGAQWRALRQGLAWRREGRNLSVARWIGRMHVGSASKRLPMLVDLMAMPPPRRSFWRPVLLLGCLAAVAAFGLSVYRSPTPIDFGPQWDRLRAAVTARVHPPDLASAPTAPSTSGTPGMPAAQEATPEVRDTSPPPAQAPTPETPAATATDNPPAAAAASASEAPASAPPASTVTPLAPPAPAPSPVAAPPPPVASADSLAPAPRSTPPIPAPNTPRSTSPNTASKLSAPAPAESDPARAPETAPAAAARIELAADSFVVQPGDSAAHILVRRTGATRSEVRFVWWTESATASADQDFVSWGHRTQRIAPGQSNVTLLVPIIKDPSRSTPRKFYVHIAEDPGSAKLGAIIRATVQLHGPG